MKKLVGLLFLGFLMVSISCKKSEGDSIAPQLVGKWKDLGSKGSITASILGQTQTEKIDEPASGNIIEFKSDGTITDGSGVNDIKFTKFRTSGNKLTFTALDDGKTFDFTYNYNVSGKILTLTMGKDLFVQNINNIVASGASNEFADLKEFKEFFTAIDITTTFEKQ